MTAYLIAIYLFIYIWSGFHEVFGSSKNQYLLNLIENENGYITEQENILERSYHGLIRENETFVEITPLIKVNGEKVCSFRIEEKLFHEIPFQIVLVNNLGILKSKKALNCERHRSYNFNIAAIYCDGTPSNTANVHITVIDINEFAPVFEQSSYVTEVDEGRLYSEIIRVAASDKDCTPLFGDVCKYKILNSDGTFKVDREGAIQNTRPLFHKDSHNHILSVVAYDCAMKESTPVMVSIKVRKVCEKKLLGIPQRIDYTSTVTEIIELFPKVRLELCDHHCNNKTLKIRTSVSLITNHISFGCDREVYNCFDGIQLIDLLPQNSSLTSNLTSDEGVETLFKFDGLSGVTLANQVVSHHDFSSSEFSILTIFRHVDQTGLNNVKEHIVCSADDHKMNRHHMALFVRNCRLIFLLRKNSREGDLNVFSPAEWRWKVPQVCDNQWHHYTLNVNAAMKIDLYIDGMLFKSPNDDERNNPEVIDDWPLHAAQGINTTLTVGACYQSSTGNLKHGFRGEIAEVKLLLKDTLKAEQISCSVSCAEHLVSPLQSSTNSPAHLQVNNRLNKITIEADSIQKIETLLRKIQYKNSKRNPTIGRRNIEIRASLMCLNETITYLPAAETYIMVTNQSMPSKKFKTDTKLLNELRGTEMLTLAKIKGHDMSPKIISNEKSIIAKNKKEPSTNKNSFLNVFGNNNDYASYAEIRAGIHILSHINIKLASLDNNEKQTLDSCNVAVYPSLNPDHEDLQILAEGTLLSTLEIKTNINRDGVDMIGCDNIKNYLVLLHSLVYSNKKPAFYLDRVFKLTCAQTSAGEYRVGEYTLTLTILHPKPTLATVGSVKNSSPKGNSYGILYNKSEAISSSTGIEVFSYVMKHGHDIQEPHNNVHDISTKDGISSPVILIVLMCAFAIVLIGTLFAVRIKSSYKSINIHRPSIKDVSEGLVWDDSALTITINPMQVDGVCEYSTESESSETEDEDDVKEEFVHGDQLEWDNSNIFSAVH